MNLKIRLTQNQQKMIFVGVLCLASVGYLYTAFFWLPISGQERDAQGKIKDVESKISVATREAERMPRLESQIADLEKQAGQISQQLPNKKDVGQILITLSQLAQRYGVSIVSFSPGPKTVKPYFFELHYPLVIEGRFHDVGKFFAAISLEKRIFNVENVSFGSADPETGIMQVSLTLLTYQYKT